jgi:hypothetical protein
MKVMMKLTSEDRFEIDLSMMEILQNYHTIKRLSDGRICGVHRLSYHWSMQIDIDYIGYNDSYCFATFELAIDALQKYDGETEPIGWHRHPKSGRRRNLETGEEWIAW